jgi:hypothetical protein
VDDQQRNFSRPARIPVEDDIGTWKLRIASIDPKRIFAAAVVPEECLILDKRAGQTPAQFVECKLLALLKGAYVPISHLQESPARRRSAVPACQSEEPILSHSTLLAGMSNWSSRPAFLATASPLG